MPFLSTTYRWLLSEGWRAAFGALAGMALCTVFLHAITPGSHWMLAPLGATLMILYVQPHSPVAQPWPVIGSYLLSCLAGLACAQWVAVPQLCATLAVACSIWLMVRLDCIHPPGAALALGLALDGPHSGEAALQLAVQVGLNVGMAMLSTMLVSNLLLRRPYPFTAQAQALGRHQTADAAPMRRIGLVHADLASAVKALDTFVDVQEDELVDIYNLAVDHAFGRHVGLTCADIMSRDVITAHFDTDLEEAWSQLRLHKIKSLPVVDGFDRLIGIATVADFLRQMDDTSAAGMAIRLQGLLRRTPGVSSAKAEVVGQIMTAKVFSAHPETPIAPLVVQMTDNGLPHIPIIDAQRKVVGMVTQSDMLAALYKRIAVSEAVAAA
ncbi:HPP family protein [Rhodoferax lacus]|nr:CBS domain-containing protein [Rhodoferax lacus]